jgi:monoamine oxidase
MLFGSYKMIKIVLISFLLGLSLQQEKIHEVIVIGAGLAGIGASKTLTEKGIPHLMIEARDKIGGRVTDIEFEGATVQLGGLLLHSPNKEHPILDIMRNELNWPTIHAGYGEKEGYYYEN